MSAMSNRNYECNVSINKYEYLYDNHAKLSFFFFLGQNSCLHGNISTTGNHDTDASCLYIYTDQPCNNTCNP